MAKGREVSLAKLFVCPGFFCSNKSEHAELVRPKLTISLFTLTRPTLSKSADWNVFIENLPSLLFLCFFRFAQNSFCWKFRILDSFCQKINIFALLSTSLSSKLWNRNIFNFGLTINSYEPLHYKKSENSLAIFIMKGAASEAGNTYPSGAPELTPSF